MAKRLWLSGREMRKIVPKAHLVVWEGNLAYLVFCLPFAKNKCAKLRDSKNGFVKPKTVLIKLFLFSHTSLPSLVRSKREVLRLRLVFGFLVGWFHITFSRLVLFGIWNFVYRNITDKANYFLAICKEKIENFPPSGGQLLHMPKPNAQIEQAVCYHFAVFFCV